MATEEQEGERARKQFLNMAALREKWRKASEDGVAVEEIPEARLQSGPLVI